MRGSSMSMFAAFRTPVLAPVLKERVVGIVLIALALLQIVLMRSGGSAMQCSFHASTGFSCPGCGVSRGLVLFSQGDWLGAIAQNWMLPLYVGLIALTVLSVVLVGVARVRLIEGIAAFERRTGITLLVVLAIAVYGGARLLGESGG